MGCPVSKRQPENDESPGPPETWVEDGRQRDPRKAEVWNETCNEFRKLRDNSIRDAFLRRTKNTDGSISIDDRVHQLFLTTDRRVATFYNWAIDNMAFSDIHKASKDEEIIDTCLAPCWGAGVLGQIVWRGIKDEEEPNPVITRATELGWEPVKTRLNRILAPSTVSDSGAIKWNLGP